MTYELLGANVSPFVRKVRALCLEKGIEYTLTPVDPFQKTAEFLALSPLGKIPVLRDGDVSFADSSVICMYLERRHPRPAMLPGDNVAHCRALWFEEYMDSAFVPKMGNGIFFPLVVAPVLMGEPVTDEKIAAAEKAIAADIEPMWDYLESQLQGAAFVGDAITLADIAVASGHLNLRYAGYTPDSGRWPKLAAFLERMYARPSFATLIAEETPQWGARMA